MLMRTSAESGKLVHLLRVHGHHIEVYKCRRLANVTYEDQFQVLLILRRKMTG